MLVVADTGPPHYLILIDAIEILPKLFQRLLLPDAVQNELRHPYAPGSVRRWIERVPAWVELAATLESDPVSRPDLGAGERAAIALAVSRRANLVLMDDRQGAAAAFAAGLTVIGTIGVLDRAARRGLIDLGDAIVHLRTTNFRYPPDLLDALLAQHEARKP